MLSEGQSIASKPLRRIEEGEIVKALDIAVKDDASGLDRLHCHVVDEQSEGWVSIAGNAGAVFLEHFGSYHSCAKETIMTDELAAGSRPVKRINREEVLEVLELPRRD